MSYEFKTLGSVEALTEVPENANVLVEVDGAIKRAPGGALGGSSSGSNGGTFVLHKDYDVDNYWFDEGVSLQLYETMRQNIYPQIVIIEEDGTGLHTFKPATGVILTDYATSGSGIFLSIATMTKDLNFTFYDDNFNYDIPA